MFTFKIGKKKIFTIIWDFKNYHAKRNPIRMRKPKEVKFGGFV